MTTDCTNTTPVGISLEPAGVKIIERITAPITERVFAPICPKAVYYESDGALQVSTRILIPVDLATTDPEQLVIFQNFYLSAFGHLNLQYYISCSWDPHKIPEYYMLYEVSFFGSNQGLPNPMTLADICQVELFVWNDDPKTSRGTVTTVTPAT